MKKSFRDRLKEDRPILFDGATGTVLYDKGLFINQCFDQVNLTHGDLVRSVHKEYVDAGADVIETNTFGANFVKLKQYGYEKQLEKINRRAVELALEAAGDRVLVAGAMGPLGIKIEPYGPTSFEEARTYFRQQAKALHEAGVDLFVLETFSRSAEMREAINGIRDVCDKAIVAMITVNDFGQTLFGTEPVYILPEMERMQVEAFGINCSVGPKVIFDVLEQCVKYANIPLVAMPNAGSPKSVDGRNFYLCTPEYMATYAKRLLKIGVKLIGGCCGTQPDHIRAMAQAVGQSMVATIKREGTPQLLAQQSDPPSPVVPFPEKSSLAKKISEGKFVFSVEVLPPKGCDPSKVLKQIAMLRDNGVDAINIPDGPRASSRMSPQVLAMLVELQLNMETILHYCCRDRNILGIQSDLLGDYAGGLKNILAVTGDPPKLGNYPDATAVFDVDSIGLVNIIHRLNCGIDLGNNNLKKPTGYAIGVAFNHTAINLEEELRRFRWKVEAGAEFVITQPVFDAEGFLRVYEKIAHYNLPIIAGIWPLVSFKNAEFMNNEVPGVSVPDDVLDRMQAAGSGEDARKIGLEIAVESAVKMAPVLVGAQVSAPLGKYKLALKVVNQIRDAVKTLKP